MNYDPAKYPKCTVPQTEVTRLKGLGFLRDKTTADCFNVRVITANGKITSEEMNAISEAAQKFGDGEIAMTVRLTCEIQRVPYEKAEALIAFLKERGLETGGTGAWRMLALALVTLSLGTLCVLQIRRARRSRH